MKTFHAMNAGILVRWKSATANSAQIARRWLVPFARDRPLTMAVE
jgi:hypothetical protein